MKFIQKLTQGTLVFDGGMGTYYAEKYGREPECCEFANIQYPDRIEGIHREYIAAGCDAIKTNTFGANAEGLDCDWETVSKLIESGWIIANKAIFGTDITVFADIGPIPHTENVDNTPQYIEIVDCFIKLGAEHFLFETFSSPDCLSTVTQHIKSIKPNSIIICSFAVSSDGFTREGVSLSKIQKAMSADKNVDIFGLNCLSGPIHMAKLISELSNSDKPLIAMPNAGYPTLVGNRVYFENNSEYYAKGLVEIANSGAAIIGGCCGTTPEHILKTRSLLGHKSVAISLISAPKQTTVIERAQNRLWDKIESEKKVFAVELDPPANSDIRAFMDGARALRDAGADAITIADCPISRARADSSMLASKLKRELDIDPIPHMTCRDRNIIATKALLLGLNIEGVNNVLVVTGDPIPTADRGTIKSVFNFNSVVLANYIHDLGEDFIRGPFRVYGALNLNALNFENQLRHAKEKLEHGVDAFLTQPVHSPRALENLKLARQELSGKILGGVMPIVSHRNACYMNSEIAGISVSDEIVRRYEGLDKEQASHLAVSLTTEIAQSMSEFVDGYYMITPFMRTDLICKIMNHLK
ncbi:MAG: bifunctional homocysteine S-methyltransferase/methylenetetrahydrofolate reductase [Oscillospiraceae bacterium]|nr:bifunctional homocysteine S-methyltransferase/methylenetetrahydrofolate reductase [Oscillospiraceae bacterium]